MRDIVPLFAACIFASSSIKRPFLEKIMPKWFNVLFFFYKLPIFAYAISKVKKAIAYGFHHYGRRFKNAVSP